MRVLVARANGDTASSSRPPASSRRYSATRLAELCRNDRATVRRRAARHTNTGPEDLCLLAVDPDETVRMLLARRRDLPDRARFALAADPEMRVRWALVEHQDDPEVLMALTADAEPIVRIEARLSCWLIATESSHRGGDLESYEALMGWFCAAADAELRRTAAWDMALAMSGGPPDDTTGDAVVCDILRQLAHDPDPETAAAATHGVVRRGLTEDIAAVCANPTLDLRLGQREATLARFEAALQPDCGPATLKALTRDQAAVVAAAALVHPRCPRAARWRSTSRDRSLRKATAVMRGRRWRALLVLAQRPEDLHKPAGVRRGAVAELFKRHATPMMRPGADYFRHSVYDAERLWDYALPGLTLFETPEQVRRFLLEVLAHRDMRRRRESADIADRLIVRFDGRMRRTAGTACSETATIRLNPKAAVCRVAVHELAHLLAESDPRFMDGRFPLGSHGAEFTAAMLDLVNATYGARLRRLLHRQYRRHAVPVLRRSLLRRCLASRSSRVIAGWSEKLDSFEGNSEEEARQLAAVTADARADDASG